MCNEDWKVLVSVTGSAYAEILRGLLEAQGIKTWLSQEGVGKYAYPVTTGIFGKVEILVLEAQFELAQSILAEVDAGKLEGVNREPDNSDLMNDNQD